MKIRLFSFCTVYLIFFFTGIQAGAHLFSKPAQSSLGPAISRTASPEWASTPVASLGNGQRSLLFVTADNLENRKPRLQSVWLIIYAPPDPTLTFLPIFPELSSKPERLSTLERSFRIERTADDLGSIRLAPSFLTTLQGQDIWWSGYILLDNVSLEHMEREIKTAGSVSPEANGTEEEGFFAGLLSGKITTLPMFSSNATPEETIFADVAFYQKVCWGLSRGQDQNSFLALDKLFDVYPLHIMSDMDHTQVLAELENVRDHNGSISCEFPTVSAHVLSFR